MSNSAIKKKRGTAPNRRAERAKRRMELHAQVVERAGGRCEWAGCLEWGVEMAHISGSGMGGDPKGIRDTLHNVAFLCKTHHHMLDGRIRMSLFEVGELLRAHIKTKTRIKSAYGGDDDVDVDPFSRVRWPL